MRPKPRSRATPQLAALRSAGMALLAASGALRAGGAQGRGGSRGGSSGRSAEGDVALDRPAELDQVRVPGPCGECEHGSGGTVHRNAARHEIGEHGERYGEGRATRPPELGEEFRGGAGPERGGARAELSR